MRALQRSYQMSKNKPWPNATIRGIICGIIFILSIAVLAHIDQHYGDKISVWFKELDDGFKVLFISACVLIGGSIQCGLMHWWTKTYLEP